MTALSREVMERDLAAHLRGVEGVDLVPRSDQANLKSYVIEAHAAESREQAESVLRSVAERADAMVSTTDDPSLFVFRTTLTYEGATEPVGFWVDMAHPRFWLLHAKTNAGPSRQAIRRMVSISPALDIAWLPRNQLRQVQSRFRPFGFRLGFDERPFYRREVNMLELSEPTHKLNVEHAGVGAEPIYQLLEQSSLTRRAMAVAEVAFWDRDDTGVQLMRLTRDGRLRSSGQSLDTHLHAARSLLRSYEHFIVGLEGAFRLRFASNDSDVPLSGRPLGLRATKPEGFEFKDLVHRLASGVEPFRLLGTVTWPEEDLAWVEAVDLHTGSPVRLDITPDWFRAYLGEGLCGNTLARLVTNLQRTYDASLGYFDETDAELFGLTTAVAA